MIPQSATTRRLRRISDVVVEVGLAKELIERPAEDEREVPHFGEELVQRIGGARRDVLGHRASSLRCRAGATGVEGTPRGTLSPAGGDRTRPHASEPPGRPPPLTPA